jgi:pimeloyl-ACP methyl ester carboxylesterase
MAKGKLSPIIGGYVTFDVDDCEYRVFFSENGEGPPLVCQHTAGTHNNQYRYMLEDEDITSRHRVIAFDMARHGKSDPPLNKEWWKEDYRLTADHFVNFIIGFCDALELEAPIFMGSSFSGCAALHLALKQPERFGGIIALQAAAYAPGYWLDWWRHPQTNAAQVCSSGVWDMMAPMSPDADRWVTMWYHAQGAEVLKGDLHFYSMDHDLRETLRKIDTAACPLVMMTGAYDYLTPPAVTKAAADQIPGSLYVEMENLGHFPMSENYPLFRPYLDKALAHIGTANSG